MFRAGLTFVAVLFLLALVPSAGAKAPPDGIRLCGVERCITVGSPDDETIFAGLDGGWRSPAKPAPYYVLRWNWPGQPEQSAYFLPRAVAVRADYGNGATWSGCSAATIATITREAAGLTPFPAPTPASVTVGARAVRSPETYLRLLDLRRLVWVYHPNGWLKVTLNSDTPSPWTDSTADIRLSARGSFVWIDSWVYKIPLRIAQRARKGLPLS